MKFFYWHFLAICVIFCIKPVTSQPCPKILFECQDGTCVYPTDRCSGERWCPDGTDEVDCDGNCTTDEFQCASGACIPLHKKCNRIWDCAGGDDEINCTISEGCRYHEFQCFPSMKCVNYYIRCYNRCEEGDEPTACDGQCGPDEFECHSGACIPNYHRCDGAPDCIDEDDERECDESEQNLDENGCGPRLLDCNVHGCARLHHGCFLRYCHANFTSDCITGECGPGEHKCRSGFCLPDKYVCDGFHDCLDFDDDEANCPVISPNCTATGVSASLPGSYVRSLLPEAGDQLEMIGDDSTPLVNCFALKDNQTDQYNMNFLGGIEQCSANIIESDSEIVVTYKVSLGVADVSASQIITRSGESTVVEFQCAYNRSGIATLSQPLFAMISHVEVDLGKTSSSFNMEMARYTSENFTTTEMEQTITIGSPVYIGVKIDVEADSNLVLQGMHCDLRPTENEIETVYSVVIGGCAAPDPINAGGNVIYNLTDPRKFGFSFLGFSWSGIQDELQEIWVSCSMNICESNEDNDCRIDCSMPGQFRHAVKRSIVDETHDATKLISLGPFVLAPELSADDKFVCSKDDVGCSHMCGVNTAGLAYCFCPKGYFLMKDGKTCLEVSRDIETLMEVYLFIGLCLILLIILVLTLVIMMQKKNVKKIDFEKK